MDNIKAKPTLDELVALFKGKGGGPEGETVLVDNNEDKKDGFITVWSDTASAAKIIQRCKKDIIDYNYESDGVMLKIDRRAYRGSWCAFRSTKDETTDEDSKE